MFVGRGLTYVAAGLALAGFSLAGVQTVRLANERAAHAATVAAAADGVADQYRETMRAVEAIRAEEARRRALVVREVENARGREKQNAADLADARAAGQRLRDALARLDATGNTGTGTDPTTANGGDPTRAASDLRALVQRRLDEAADTVAGFADQSRTRGLTCERLYNGLAPVSANGAN